MEKRYFLFALLSALILIGWVGVLSVISPPREVAQQPPGIEVEEERPADADDPLDPAAVRPPADPDDEPALDPLDQEDVPPAAEPVVRAEPRRQWATLGSAAPESTFPFLATFTSRGAALERVELTARGRDGKLRFRDVDDDTGYLGHLELQDVAAGGVRVQVVGDGTPAAFAVARESGVPTGLQPGDVITGLNDAEVATLAAWNELFARTEPGDEITLTVERPGDEATETLHFFVRLTAHPLEVIAPDYSVTAGLATQDPLSCLLTIARLGGVDGKMVSFDLDRPSRLRSLADVDWDMRLIDDPLPAVEFRFTLLPEDLQRVGLDGQWEIVKRYSMTPPVPVAATAALDASFHMQMDIELRNLGDQPQRVAYRLTGPNGLPTEGWWYQSKIHPQMFAATGARDIVWRSEAEGHRLLGGPKIYSNAQKAHDSNMPIVTSIVAASDAEPRRTIHNVGVDTQYFAAAFIPGTVGEPEPLLVDELVAYPVGGIADIPKARIRKANVSFALVSPTFTVAPQGEIKQSFVLFTGPKDPPVLAAYGVSEYLEYGWGIFELFARPLSGILHLFARIPPYNYGIAIILLTMLVRACMFPISRKAAKSAAKMQELAPELKKISEKYKDDLQKQRTAQQELYRKHNFNPFGSCLLMFFQLPVFIGLYRALSIDIELRQAPLIPGIQWASNLAAPDMLFRWDHFLPEFIAGEGTGWLGPYFNILPVVTILLFLVQQKMFTPPPTDDQMRAQQKMMTFMMIFMGVLFFRVPSGLCLYFIVSSLWGITERKMLPKTTPVESTETKPEPPAKRAASSDGRNGAAKKAAQRKKQKRR